MSLMFDSEATVEELIGMGRRPHFDSVVNDKEDESIQVICKRGDDEILLANPAVQSGKYNCSSCVLTQVLMRPPFASDLSQTLTTAEQSSGTIASTTLVVLN